MSHVGLSNVLASGDFRQSCRPAGVPSASLRTKSLCAFLRVDQIRIRFTPSKCVLDARRAYAFTRPSSRQPELLGVRGSGQGGSSAGVDSAHGGSMRLGMRLLVMAVLCAALTAAAIRAQITSNPIPAPIVKRGLAVEIRELVRLPDTRGTRPLDQDVSPSGWARVSYVRDLPDGRRFANDSRGFLYLIGSDNQPASTRTSARCSRTRSTTASKAGSSASSFTRSSLATGSSTPCTPNGRPAIPRRPTSFRPVSRRRT